MGKIYIGIDVGINGAIAVLQDGKIIEKILMPIIEIKKSRNDYDLNSLVSFFKKYNPSNSVVVIEQMRALPLLGGVQSLNLGKGFGYLVGMVSALGYPYHVVSPRTWQSVMLSDVDKTNTKIASVLIANRLFPNENFKPTARSKKDHHGLTDAVLLGKYGEQRSL